MGLKSDFKESFKSDIKSDFKLKRKKYNELRNLLRKRKQTSIFEKEHFEEELDKERMIYKELNTKQKKKEL